MRPPNCDGPFRHLLASDSVIFRVGPNPKPLNAAWNFVTKCSVVIANADRPHFAQAFEMERRVPRVGLEKLEILVRERSHWLWQRIVERPEASGRRVLQSGRDLLFLWSAIESSMRRSSFPAAVSVSI